MQEDILALVPENTTGKQISLEQERTDNTADIANNTFKRAAKRLLNFDIWNELCGVASASFKIFGNDGKPVNRLATVNDFIRINIPGPGTVSGGGYDWVIIEKLVDGSSPDAQTEHFLLQVRPCSPPFGTTEPVSHFLTERSTSTFILSRKDMTTTAYYFGRNEEMNNEIPNVLDKIRNTAVAFGSFSGIAKAQWGSLLKGVLADEIGGW